LQRNFFPAESSLTLYVLPQFGQLAEIGIADSLRNRRGKGGPVAHTMADRRMDVKRKNRKQVGVWEILLTIRLARFLPPSCELALLPFSDAICLV